MSNLKMTAIEKLSGLTKSPDLKAALNDIQGEITAVEETIGALKKQMAAAPFEGGADKVASIRKEMRAISRITSNCSRDWEPRVNCALRLWRKPNATIA